MISPAVALLLAIFEGTARADGAHAERCSSLASDGCDTCKKLSAAVGTARRNLVNEMSSASDPHVPRFSSAHEISPPRCVVCRRESCTACESPTAALEEV